MKKYGDPALPAFASGGSPPRSVLIIVTRRIGDVLLATPLARSVKRAWPETALDMLVFEGTQGAIDANPDIRRVLAVPERPGGLEHLAFVAGLVRRYDVALSTLPGDRPTLYAFLAGRWRAGLLNATPKERWKQPLLHRWVPFDNWNTHTVPMNLALAGALGVEPRGEVVVSWRAQDAERVDALLGRGSAPPLAVLHPHPKFNYKMWHRAGWLETAGWLSARGHRVVLSGGPDPAEITHVAGLARAMPPGTLNLAGRLSLAQSGCLVSRAAVFLGPDTALTHMAAALGVPTVALYGPTDPVKWGPWPKGHAPTANPWRRLGRQAAGRVSLVQGNAPCAPCHKEGCERNVESYSDCLQQLPAARVIAEIAQLLDQGKS
ncbi:MAG: glycosyltransferase family 9 protein [Betaproteobacteria bacterium]|nr:glycosyltransferase family 9 protein [Betaproteobacteria bacterium]